ncbi:hypothetical protein [Cyclobacterium xiamenense]|uniref:hypothetical protein n=1 Tax=Cyclobacterium xiamenense TaxID=1297121 RepID=UPI0035CF04CE
MNRWILYTFLLGLAAYWASNLLLWFPWSYSPYLGMTLMLTIAPIIWAYVAFLALRTYPKAELLRAASMIAAMFLVLAVVMDYIFFGIIRNAMEELYHPTTFYGYGFLVVWPFVLVVSLKRKIVRRKKTSTTTDLLRAGISGLIGFSLLTLIIMLEIELAIAEKCQDRLWPLAASSSMHVSEQLDHQVCAVKEASADERFRGY